MNNDYETLDYSADETCQRFHIPYCEKKCNVYLSRLVEELKSREQDCVFQYPKHGEYLSWFEKYLKDKQFTILHKCQHHWCKIKRGEWMQNSSTFVHKIMCVKWTDINCAAVDNRQESGPSSVDFDEFFGKLQVHDISDKIDFLDFVNDVSKTLGASANGPDVQLRHPGIERRQGSIYSPMPGIPPRMPLTREQQRLSRRLTNKYYINEFAEKHWSFLILSDLLSKESPSQSGRDGQFVLCPNMLGQTGHHHTTVWTNIKDNHEREYSTIKNICDAVEADIRDKRKAERSINSLPVKDVINRYLATDETPMSKGKQGLKRLHFVICRVLPEFYDKNCPVGLACVAVCSQPGPQERALTLLELLLLTQSTRNRIGFKDLIDTGAILRDAMIDVGSEYQLLSSDGYSLKDKIFNVLMMVLSQLRLDYQLRDINSNLWDAFCEKSKSVLDSPSHNPRGSSTEDRHVNLVLKFMETSQKNMANFVHRFLATKTTDAGKLLKRKERTQYIVLFECLKRIFHSEDLKLFDFLNEFLQLGKKKKYYSWECFKLISLGLSHFLSYVCRESGDKDITKVCKTGIKTTIMACEMCPVDERFQVVAIMRQLLFNNIPLVQSRAAEKIEKEKSTDSLEEQILKGTEELLFPFLKMKENTKASQDVVTKKDDWFAKTGTFSGKSVRLVAQKKLSVANSTNMNKRDSTQMTILGSLHLQHPSIVKLIAYQRDCMPGFFIFEHDISLQEVLKNHTVNGKPTVLQDLIRHLWDAASAVEFLHQKQIAHCNLTAACLKYIDGKIIKLSCFELAVLLGKDEEEKRVGCKETKKSLTRMNLNENNHSEIDHCKKIKVIRHAFCLLKVLAMVDDNMKDIPTRWSDPKTLKGRKFSKKTDVYMFGLMMYEVLTHGGLPYSHLQLSDAELVRQLLPRVDQRRPKLCKEGCVAVYLPNKASPETHIQKEHFDLITKCVDFDPERRPPIAYIKRCLEDFLGKVSDDTIIGWNHKCKWNTHSTDFGKGVPVDLFSYTCHLTQSMVFIKKIEGLTFYKSDHGFLIRQHARNELYERLCRPTDQCLCRDLFAALPCLFIEINEGLEEEVYNTLDQCTCFLDFHIPEANLLDLNTVLEQRIFGENIQKYLALLPKVLKQLKALHQNHLVLGKFSASNFYVNPDLPEPKVYTIGLGTLQMYSPETNTLRSRNRAPSQEKPNGTHTPASDILYFGHLLKKFFIQLGISVCKRSRPLTNNTKPCCRSLDTLADLCLDREEAQRPTLQQFLDEMNV